MFEIYNDKKESYKTSNIQIPNFTKQKFCVFDLEGTGLDYLHDDIIQFGAICIEDGKIMPNYLDIYVCPSKKIPEKIEELTGISNERVKDAALFPEAYKKFLSFSTGRILIAQCGYEYDFRIIRSSCERNGIELPNTVELDTKILFAYLHPELSNTFSTDFLIQYYSIDVSDIKRHNAKEDSIVVGRILLNMLEELNKKCITDLVINKELEIKKFIPRPL